jgi:hypothetical protein
MSDYLWDQQGEPDPEIAELEQLLAPLAHRPRPLLPPPPPRSRRPWVLGAVGITAATAIAIALFLVRPKPPEQAGFLMSVHGSGAKLADRAITGEGKLPVGAWLDTGESQVTLTVGRIGSVELAAGSRLRIVDVTAQVLELDHGALVAQITAPPRSFTVKTKHATAIDLGCAFTLRADLTGEGRLIVTEGRVALADEHGKESIVAAGSECGISDRGPGVPFSSDVSPSFREAMLRYPHDHAALAKILAAARAKDRDALDQMSALLDAADRVAIEGRIVELQRPPGTPPVKPIDKPSTPHRAPHGGKLAPSREHKRAVKPASPVVPASSRVAPTAPVVAPGTPATKKQQVLPPTRDKLQHDPFRSSE